MLNTWSTQITPIVEEVHGLDNEDLSSSEWNLSLEDLRTRIEFLREDVRGSVQE